MHDILWLVALVIVVVIIWWFWGGKVKEQEVEEEITPADSEIEEESEVDLTPGIPTDLSVPRLSNDGMHLGVRTNSRRSKGEALCHTAIEQLTGKKFVTVRPDWLKNPETGRNLELDCYNHELKLAIEYNGVQHYKWPNYTGQSYTEFINQVRRDQFKVSQCDRYGVYLITVPYSVPESSILDYINYYLPHNVMMREQRG